MAEFIIQGRKLEDGNIIPAQDFGYSVIEAIEFEKWFYKRDPRHSFRLADFRSFKNNCQDEIGIYPVGSVEFVLDYFKYCHGIDHIAPINIPPQLEPFANRKIEKMYDISALTITEPKFIKSITRIKGHSEIVRETKPFPRDDYLVSDLIDIESEWRCFIYNGALYDAKCYSQMVQPFGRAPDLEVVKKMIEAYTQSPKAYTLDVCVDTEGRTSILEVHNFFSCGLYGFDYYSVYLSMLVAGIRWQIEQSKK